MDDKTAIRNIHKFTALCLMTLTFFAGALPAIPMEAPAWMAPAREGGKCIKIADYDNAIRLYNQALEKASQAHELDPELHADLRLQIAAALCLQHNFSQAKRVLDEVHGDLIKHQLTDKPITCRYWRRVIDLSDARKNPQDSLFAKQQVLSILGKRFGTTSPEYVSCLQSLLNSAFLANDWATYVQCARERDQYNHSRPGATMNRICEQWKVQFKQQSESAFMLAWEKKDAKSCEAILQCATAVDKDPHYLIHMRTLAVRPSPPELQKLQADSEDIIRDTYFKLKDTRTAADTKAYTECLFGLFFYRWSQGLMDNKSISIGYEFLKTHSKDRQGGAAIPYIQVTGILALMLASNDKLSEAEDVLRNHRIAPKQLNEGGLLNGPVQARTELASRYRKAGHTAEARKQFDELVTFMNEQNISAPERTHLLNGWRRTVLMEK